MPSATNADVCCITLGYGTEGAHTVVCAPTYPTSSPPPLGGDYWGGWCGLKVPNELRAGFAVAFAAMPAHLPLGLSDRSLGLLFAAAGVVPHALRGEFLLALAAQLTTNTPTDDDVQQALAHTLNEGSRPMLANLIHRLRVRANEASEQNQVGLAQDLRLTVDYLVRLQHDQQFTVRPTTDRPKISA